MENTEVRRVMVPHGLSLTTAKLIESIKDGKVGDTYTDAQGEACCGRPVGPKGAGYSNLMSAIRYVRRLHGVVWERVAGEHLIKCLNAKEIVTSSDASGRRVRKESLKAVQKLRTIKLDDVEQEDRGAILSRMAQHGTISEFARAATQKKIEASGKTHAVSAAKILESLK